MEEIKEVVWSCLTIAERYNKPSHFQKIVESLHKVFGQDIKVEFINQNLGEDLYLNSVLNYIFVNIENLLPYKKRLMNVKYLEKHDNFSNIMVIKDNELRELINSCVQANKQPVYYFGDIVTIQNGTYKGLTGIIVDYKNDLISVLFNFCFGSDIVEIPSCNIEYHDNLFNIIKVPK